MVTQFMSVRVGAMDRGGMAPSQINFDGAPYEVKVSRTVRSGGKGGKWCENAAQTLPIAIDSYTR